MVLQPNQKKNQLGLTGSNLYSWQSKPMQGRQPSGASAPRAPQSDYYSTPGVANRAGVPKAPTAGPEPIKNWSYTSQAPAPAASMGTQPQSSPYTKGIDQTKADNRADYLSANVPPQLAQKYYDNKMAGRTKLSPEEAVAYYKANYQAPAVAQGAVQGLQDRGNAQLSAAQAYATGVNQLKDTGVKNYGDYNYKTGLQNQTTEARNASLEAELQRQEAGGGLKATNQQLSNLYGIRDAELASREAAAFNTMSAADQEKKDAFNKAYDEGFAKYQAIRTPAPEVGVEPPVYMPKQRTPAQEEGLARRREQAAAQAAYRSDAAALMGQGLSPQQAHQALARQRAMDDFYNANVAMEQAQSQGQVAAARINSNADMYKATTALTDSREARKEAEAQRIYTQQQDQNAKAASVRQRAQQMFPGDDLNNPSTPGGQWVEDEMAVMRGGVPKDRFAEAMAASPENRSKSQRDVLIRTAKTQIANNPSLYNIEENTSIGAVTSKAKELGLNTDDTLRLIGEVYMVNPNVPEDAYKLAKKLSDDLMEVKGTDRYDSLLATYGDAINALSTKLTDTQKFELFGSHDAQERSKMKEKSGIDSDAIMKKRKQDAINNEDKRRREEEEYRRKNPVPSGFSDSSYLGTLS